jgi:patatin-related protein
VSLAIWISGVTLELHHLAMASRWDETTYRPLLDLLWADARIDVIAGTSAGGLNGAFLALGLTRDRDLTLMRDLWREHGSLEKLLRDPLRKNPPSLLMGDDYFLPQVRDALARMLDQGPHGPSSAASADWPVELILTGTLWQGRTTSFTDDMGAAITEIDHDARFRLTLAPDSETAAGDLASGGLVDQLAAAARCTSSFPAAFEPHFVEVTDRTAAGEGPWGSRAGKANFRSSQYVVDGGVLLNKPIRPALEAIYRQTAEFQVRRVLAYVVPDPGEPRPAKHDSAPDDAIPQARDVLLGVLTRLRSTDSVSRELTEIRTRNADAHQRRRARDRLAAAMITTADPLSAQAWPGYIEVRIAHAARSIGQLIAAGQQAASGRWSERDLVSALQELLRARRARPAAEQKADPFFIPWGELQGAVERDGADWDWGATTVQRLGDMAVDVLKRAVWLAPTGSEWQKKIVKARMALSSTLETIRTDRSSLDAYWSTAPSGATSAAAIPVRETMDALGTATSAATAKLNKWLSDVLDGWDRVPAPEKGAGGRREQLHGQALAVAKCLHACAAAIDEVAGAPYESTDAPHLDTEQLQALARSQDAIDPDGEECKRLRALYDYLLARPTEAPDHTGAPEHSAAAPDPATAPGPELVLKRMLRLDVVQLAFAGASQEVEQEVELVQFSAKQPETLTGVQLLRPSPCGRPSC